jgi:hypothetical protein
MLCRACARAPQPATSWPVCAHTSQTATRVARSRQRRSAAETDHGDPHLVTLFSIACTLAGAVHGRRRPDVYTRGEQFAMIRRKAANAGAALAGGAAIARRTFWCGGHATRMVPGPYQAGGASNVVHAAASPPEAPRRNALPWATVWLKRLSVTIS